MRKAPPDNWTERTYHVVPDETLARQLRAGEILRHRSGVLLLKCPACNALQFVVAKVEGPDQAPTVDKPVTCGNGVCLKCAVTYRIRSGKVVEAQAPEPKQATIPDHLRRAGVRSPPLVPTDRAAKS